jgi:alpha-galactosidase
MTPRRTPTSVRAITLDDDALLLRVEVGSDGVARLARFAAAPGDTPRDDRRGGESGPAGESVGLPLLDVVTAGSGRARTGRRYVESATGGRMRYLGHEQRADDRWRELRVLLEDPETLLRAECSYRVLAGGGTLQATARLSNAGRSAVIVESVTSFVASGIEGPEGELGEVDLWWAENDWLGEGRWQHRFFRDALPDLNRRVHDGDSRAMFGLTSEGSWSSGGFLPMGAAVNRRTGHAWLWQIEHNGAWHWQVGEHSSTSGEHRGRQARADGAPRGYVALLGPTDAEHHWRLVLEPGESFETVPAAVALSGDGLEGAVARLTRYRRAARRGHPDHEHLPVIFNDYMNTLMGEPTTERLLPLVTAASSVGAEVFCIDSGWYAELGQSWWDTVGAWRPSASRFPNGIDEVLDAIRAHGMVPGLWLEPEVVGARSAVASSLPEEAFFLRSGERVVEQGRYHLDLRHPAARQHLDEAVDFLVADLGVGYLKLDYNLDVGPGTDAGGVSEGVGLLGHNRALLDWLEAILDRYPSLVIENCASGAMRADFAMLSRLQLQSTSDQQDFLRYTPIAVAAPMAITPEQAASWAYPQPEWSDDEIVFALCNALLGRVHLSGHLDKMSEPQLALVAAALKVYKRIRSALSCAVPFWPLGLPRWTDTWLALGMRAPEATYVLAWRRGHLVGASPPGERTSPERMVLPVSHLRNTDVTSELLYPALDGVAARWEQALGGLIVELSRVPSACLVELRPR